LSGLVGELSVAMGWYGYGIMNCISVVLDGFDGMNIMGYALDKLT
jgi:hypothetical protein